MPGNTPDIGIKVHIEELQRFKSQVSSLDQTTEQLKKQFEGVSTSQEELSSIQKSLNNLINSYKTQVDKNGNVTTSAAKKMLAEYEKLLNAVEELDEAERKRLSQSEYEAEMQKLTGRNSRLALAKGATTRLTKQASALEAENAQISSLSGFALKKKASKGAVNYIREGNIRRGEGRGGGLSKNQKEQLEDLGASKEIIEEINRLILEQNAALDENKRKQEDIKQELKEQQGIIREENDKVDNLKKQGVKTPGTSSFTEDIGRNIPDNVDALHGAVNKSESTGKTDVNLNNVIGKTEKATNKLTKSLINYNIVLQAFKRLWHEAVRTVTEMDRALTGMTAVTGKSREEVQGYVKDIKEVAHVTSSTMTDIANLTTEFLRQGRTMQESLNLAEETAKAAKIAEISTADSIQYMTSAINGFNLEAEDASRVSDVFANVAAKTATDYEQLAVALSKVSAQANLAGMSMEFTTALLAKGIETTQEAPESIGTALKTVVARMRELTDYNKVLEDGTDINKVEAALRSAGLELRDSMGNFKDLEVVFNELGAKWDDLNTMQQQAIAQAAAGTRQQSRFIAIMQDWERTLETVTYAQEAAGAATYQYTKMSEGLGATLTNLQTSWQGLIHTMVDVEPIINILEAITSGLDTLAKAPGLIKTIVGALGGITVFQLVSNKLGEIRKGQLLQTAWYEKEIGEENAKQISFKSTLLGLLGAEKVLAIASLFSTKARAALEKKIGIEKTQQAITSALLGFWGLFIKKEKVEQLAAEGAITAEQAQQVLLQKMNGKNLGSMGKNLAKNGLRLAGIAVVLGSIVYLIHSLSQESKRVETAQEKIIENNNKIYENTERSSGISKLVEEYDELDGKINKTSEDLERMEEIQKSLKTEYDINDLDSARGEVIELNKQNQEAREQNEIELAKAYNKAGDEIWDKNPVFKKTFDNLASTYAEHTLSLEMALTGLNDTSQKLTESQKQLAKSINNQVLQNLDKSAIMENTVTSDTVQNESGALNGVGAGAVAGAAAGLAIAGSALIAAGSLAAVPVVGWVAAGVAAIVAGVATGIAHAKQKEAEKEAEKAQESIKEELKKAAQNVAVFAVSMAKAETFNKKYEAYKEFLSKTNDETSKYAKDAVEKTFSYYEAYEGEFGNLADKIVNNLEISGEQLDKLVQSYYNLGKETAQAFIKGLSEGDNKNEVLLGTIEDLYNKDSEYYKKIEKQVKENYAASIKDLQTVINLENYAGKTDSKDKDVVEKAEEWQEAVDALVTKYGWTGYTNDQIVDLASAKLTEMGTEEDAISDSVKDYAKLSLDMISSIDDIQALNDALTGLNSRKDTYTSYAEKAAEGSLTGEEIASILSDEVYQEINEETGNTFAVDISEAIKAGNNSRASALISSGYNGITQLLNDLISDYEDRLKGEEKIAQNSGNESELEAVRQKQQITSLIKTTQPTFGKEGFSSLVDDNKLRELEDKLEKSSEYTTEELDSFIKEASDIYSRKINRIEETIGSWITSRNFEDNELVYKYLEAIYKGEMTFEEFEKETSEWTTDARQNFYDLYYTVDDFFDQIANLKKEQESLTKKDDEEEVDPLQHLQDLIEAQNKMVEAYKEKLKEEQEALQESLDKRKEMYEKYFDALENEVNDEDFEEKQEKLQKAIASLATASDASSLAKMKELQEELDSLEEEQLSTERERRRDSVMSNLDNEGELMNQYYEDRMENEQALWEEITSMSRTEIDSLMQTYTSEYKNATDLNKMYLLASYKDINAKVLEIMGNKEGAEAASAEYKNYNNYLAKFSMDQSIGPYDSTKQYSTGGIVDYTGLAVVHGSASKPEAFLNSSQTAMFANLAANLQAIYKKPQYMDSNYERGDSISIEEFTVAVDAVLNNDNIPEVGNSLAEALFDGIRRSGFNINIKK